MITYCLVQAEGALDTATLAHSLQEKQKIIEVMAALEEHNDSDISNRLRRIEGQVRGIIRMLDEQRNCEDVITQVLAVRSAMDKVAAEILKHHVDDCLSQMPPAEAKSAISRAVQLINKVS